MEPPPASASAPTDPTPSASPPRRAWTILGRLTQAVREQNWFAVGLEVMIVVLGVVVGFQVTGWGQARADRVQEQAYLRQLVGDMRETERLLAEADSSLAPSEIAGGAVVRSFYETERPTRDTLLARLDAAGWIRPVNPVVGTIQALVATGDLTLIQNDSLRAEITSYLGKIERYVVYDRQSTDVWLKTSRDLGRGRDQFESGLGMPQPLIDSLARSDPRFPLPAGTRRRPFPLRVEAFLSDPEKLAAASEFVFTQDDIRRGRQRLRGHTVALRERIEAEIER